MTAQRQENFIMNKEACALASFPSLPKRHPRIVEVPIDEVDPDSGIFSTGCWRGYIGTWEISNAKLYLNRLDGRLRLDGDQPLFADWVSEELRVPLGVGSCISFYPWDKYDHELHLEIKEGVVIGSREVNSGADSAQPGGSDC